MRRAALVLLAACRLYGPLAALFALSLLAVRAPETGVGFLAGMAFAIVVALHALVFGADAVRAAAPPYLARVLLALGLITASCAAAAREWALAPQTMEAGLFAATCAAGALVVASLTGRAPSLRDEEW